MLFEQNVASNVTKEPACKTMQNHTKPSNTMKNRVQLRMRNHVKPLETMQNNAKPSEIT